MDITPESKFARLQILHQTFSRLTEFYQRKNLTIAWAVGNDGAEINPDNLWDKYAQDVESVRSHFMLSADSRIDRHKIVALTEPVIFECQPLAFVGDSFSANDHYRLNAEYAIFFGVQFIIRWHEVYSRELFYPEKFLNPLLATDMGYAFLQEHIKLLCAESQPQFSVFWASQMWFLLSNGDCPTCENRRGFLHDNPPAQPE
jgi:hypothetical protein